MSNGIIHGSDADAWALAAAILGMTPDEFKGQHVKRVQITIDVGAPVEVEVIRYAVDGLRTAIEVVDVWHLEPIAVSCDEFADVTAFGDSQRTFARP